MKRGLKAESWECRKKFWKYSPLNYKYLHSSILELPVGMLDASVDNSLPPQSIKVRDFNFSEEDYEVLREFREMKTAYVVFGQNYLNFAYLKAEHSASNYLNIDMKDGITSMVKKFAPSTINQYGVTLAPYLFLLFNAWRLSCFAEHAFLPHRVIEMLTHDPERQDTIVYKMKALGRCFDNCLRENIYREYLARWVRMCAFNFPAWDRTDVPCPENTVTKARRIMDTIRCLIVFTCFATTENVSETAYWLASRNYLSVINYWGWFRRLYHTVAKEGIEATVRVTVNPDERAVRVEGKLISFEYVAQMKSDLNRDLEAHVEELRRWLEFGSVSDVYMTVMANRSICVVENLSGQDSVFNVIGAEAVSGYTMRFREQESAQNEQVRASILKLVNTITKLLMLAVWINPGLALRFPELSIISFGGSHRNLYFDSDDRVFIIRSRYNKNTKYDTRLLFLDARVSAQLFWFIYILRPFTIVLLGDDISKINISAIMGALTPQEPLTDTHDTEEEVEDINFNAELYYHQMELRNRLNNASPQTIGNAIFKSMVFLDVRKLVLVHRSTFSNMLLKYPTATAMRESHRIRSMRHGLSALWKHFIAGQLYDQTLELGQAVARGFGHSVSVDAAVYGFDNSRTVGPREVPFVSAKKLCQIFQKLTQKGPLITDKACTTSAASEPDEGTIGDYTNLCEAGSGIISGFKFRSVEQERFTNMILTGDRNVLALQAPTAFGKTMTFVLPMLVLKRTRPGKYVHFVAVPYVSLKIATMQRLEEVGLAVADLKLLGSAEWKSKLKNTDVLVGTFDMFGTHATFSFINGWQEELMCVRQKGYFILDEAHALWLEQDFREELKEIHSLRWREFLKIVFISATLPAWLMDELCKQLNLSRYMVRNAGWTNAVHQVPNQKVLKEVTLVPQKEFGGAIEQRVNSYLLGTATGKAIFFFSNKARMRHCYARWKKVVAVAAVDSEMPDRVKLSVFREFESAASPVRVIIGTKLISNGLDCNAVDYVCLADCDVDMIDFLQMVGRIRGSGYLEVVRIAGKKKEFRDAVAHEDLRNVNWSKCITETVASFYSVPAPDQITSCVATRGRSKVVRGRLARCAELYTV
ncbi:hypothetical protein HG535_0A00110 [Zygotorulaspora mrakii]|uniref:ATP-dependent RNA helicase n=1 Tax=Zygotorulaspora mrakii TaxID=42260 RepID=A0A7H9AWV8_ZYGMR|nr:uncharacterized protein HG535_0A00110 [Zygotorulaspora mrakii]QLG70072.1 hypothetical protein HG535_0A00110 [Zygotorulaspora mrakii]